MAAGIRPDLDAQHSALLQVLVFSTWVDVLELVAHALRRWAALPMMPVAAAWCCSCRLMVVVILLRSNGLPYAYARQAKQFQSELRRFKCGCFRCQR